MPRWSLWQGTDGFLNCINQHASHHIHIVCRNLTRIFFCLSPWIFFFFKYYCVISMKYFYLHKQQLGQLELREIQCNLKNFLPSFFARLGISIAWHIMVNAQLVWLFSKLSVSSHRNCLSIALNMLISDSSLLAYHLSGFFPLFTKCLLRNWKKWIVCDQIKMPSAYEHYVVSCNQTLTAEKKHCHLYDSVGFPKEALCNACQHFFRQYLLNGAGVGPKKLQTFQGIL